MAATPPLQLLSSPGTPNTPLHGARYEEEDSPRPRFSSRLRQKRGYENNHGDSQVTRPARTPRSPFEAFHRTISDRSPNTTPKRKTTRQTQVLSPPSPDSEVLAPQPALQRNGHLQPFLSSHTTMSEAMLPTPVKTPKKKTVSNPGITARALFQDPTALEGMASLRRPRKTKRFNGFSLESFRTDNDSNNGGIQIFTDMRDNVPEADDTDENPFVEGPSQAVTSKKVTGTAKRRKVAVEKPLDPQVEEAIRKDEGMVYVFRGRKIYRRFDDDGEEEEEIDADDLGLLEHVSNGGRIIKPFRTMTRKSIKPTRLFQTEQQKQERDSNKDEEADTDIEEDSGSVDATPITSPSTRSKTSSAQFAHSSSSRTNSSAKDALIVPKGKKTSPFDGWRRLKPGSMVASQASRSRKRAASQELDTIGN